MTDHFTCPRCGWPQGQTHSEGWCGDPDKWLLDTKIIEEIGSCHECGAEPGSMHADHCFLRSTLTVTPKVTPDIAGLVARLRKGRSANEWVSEALAAEAADALEAAKAEIEDWKKKAHVADHNDAIARAENERLLAENEQYKKLDTYEVGYKDGSSSGYADAMEEISTLRAALEGIAGVGTSKEAWEIARAALTGEGE